MAWNPNEPYNELPDLPPGQELETRAVLKAAIEARAALAALNEAAASIPNPTVLINSIPLLEAQASSEIENIVTTTDELFKYAQDESAATNPATREALRYRSAMYHGFRAVQERPLAVNTAMEVCSLIKMHEMTVRRLPGTYIGNPVTHEAIYTPPMGEQLLMRKLSNWEDFVHGSKNLDPLVRMAACHYQFEAIHPFEDGNGRTGRVLNVLILVEAGLLSLPILYLSRFIILRKNEYYNLLQAVTSDHEWEAWILYILEGITFTSEWTMRKIGAIRALQASFQEQLRGLQASGPNADLLELLFEQPYCRIANVMTRCEVSRPTATKWLNALVDAGTLISLRVGRDKLYVNTQFLDLLQREEDLEQGTGSPMLF